MRWIGRLVFLIWAARSRFERCGVDVHVDPLSYITYEVVSIGSQVYLGRRATIVASRSEIRIGNNGVFGAEVSVFGAGTTSKCQPRHSWMSRKRPPRMTAVSRLGTMCGSEPASLSFAASRLVGER